MQAQSTTHVPIKASVAEQRLRQHLVRAGANFTKRGYPDFAVLDSAGIPFGFIEVKRDADDLRTFEQVAFERFCEQHSIPYALWWPGQPLPEWARIQPQTTVSVLEPGQAVKVDTVPTVGSQKWSVRNYYRKKGELANIRRQFPHD